MVTQVTTAGRTGTDAALASRAEPGLARLRPRLRHEAENGWRTAKKKPTMAPICFTLRISTQAMAEIVEHPMSKISIIKDAAERASSAESDRTGQLLRKAERFAAGTMLVAAFQLREAETMLESPSQQARGLYYLSLAALGVSLLCAFLAMRVKGCTDYPRGNKLWENLKPENVSEDSAQEALVQMLLKTREQNAQLNDAKAKLLFWCGWLLFAGFLLAGASIIMHVPAPPDID